MIFRNFYQFHWQEFEEIPLFDLWEKYGFDISKPDDRFLEVIDKNIRTHNKVCQFLETNLDIQKKYKEGEWGYGNILRKIEYGD